MSGPDFLRRRDALGEEHPSQLALDRLRLQEPGTETIRTHVEGCAVCQTRLKAGNEKDVVYNASTFVGKEAHAVAKRARQTPWLVRAVVGVAIAAGLAVVVVPMLKEPSSRGEGVKGNSPALTVYRHREGRVEKVQDGEVLKAGDALRFEVSLPNDASVVVVGVDGAGSVTPYSPLAGVSAMRGAGRQLLPETMQLDAVLGEERVLAFVCDKPVSVEQVRVAIAASASSPAREGCVVTARHYLKK